MTPELHRPISIERIRPAGMDVLVEANPAECAALAERLQIPAVISLICRFRLEHAEADVIVAHGALVAEIVQTCVVSLDDFPATVEEQFVLRCVPAGQERDEVDPDTPDEITFEDGLLDLGEAAAQQLALALDPYPRAPDATLPDFDEETEASPFTGLSSLKRLN